MTIKYLCRYSIDKQEEKWLIKPGLCPLKYISLLAAHPLELRQPLLRSGSPTVKQLPDKRNLLTGTIWVGYLCDRIFVVRRPMSEDKV